MIIWLIIRWLFDDYLISNNHQIIQIIDVSIDDYHDLSYLIIIWLIIWLIICDYSSESLIIRWLLDWLFDDYLWLFFWILDYLMLIWWLFDAYSNYLMIFCHFVAPKPVGSLRLDGWEAPLQGRLLLRLIAVPIPQLWPFHYHAGPATIVGYKLSASQAAMERPIQSHQCMALTDRSSVILVVEVTGKKYRK